MPLSNICELQPVFLSANISHSCLIQSPCSSKVTHSAFSSLNATMPLHVIFPWNTFSACPLVSYLSVFSSWFKCYFSLPWPSKSRLDACHKLLSGFVNEYCRLICKVKNVFSSWAKKSMSVLVASIWPLTRVVLLCHCMVENTTGKTKCVWQRGHFYNKPLLTQPINPHFINSGMD